MLERLKICARFGAACLPRRHFHHHLIAPQERRGERIVVIGKLDLAYHGQALRLNPIGQRSGMFVKPRISPAT